MPLAPHSAHYLEIGAAHREELLNHVLRALLNLALVENVSERVEHFYTSPHASTRTVQTLTALLAQILPALLRHVHCDLYRVVGRVFQQQEDQLKDQQLRGNLLVHQMGDESRQRHCHQLVVALERTAELEHYTLQQELAHLWEFRVDDGYKGGVHVREAGRGELCLHQGTAEQAATADEVLLEELGDDIADVHDVHFVDDAIQRLAQRLPCLALVRGRTLVVGVGLHAGQFEGRNVHTSRAAVVHFRSDERGGLDLLLLLLCALLALPWRMGARPLS